MKSIIKTIIKRIIRAIILILIVIMDLLGLIYVLGICFIGKSERTEKVLPAYYENYDDPTLETITINDSTIMCIDTTINDTTIYHFIHIHKDTLQ